MPATYDLGDSIRLTFTVRDITGTLVDATTATLAVTRPDGTTFTPLTPIHPGVGTYQATLVPDQAGAWLYRWAATGTAVTADDGMFLVEPNLAGTLYATVEELREALGDNVNRRLDAGKLEQRLRSASRAVDDWCARPLGRFWLDPTVTARTYQPDDPWCAEVHDIGSTVGLVVKTDDNNDGVYETTWTITTDYVLEPANAAGNGGAYSYTRIRAVGSRTFPCPYGYGARDQLQVTARHGWSQIPDPVREATLLKAIRLNRRPDAPFGNESGGLEMGSIRIAREDVDVTALLSRYRIPAGVA